MQTVASSSTRPSEMQSFFYYFFPLLFPFSQLSVVGRYVRFCASLDPSRNHPTYCTYMDGGNTEHTQHAVLEQREVIGRVGRSLCRYGFSVLLFCSFNISLAKVISFVGTNLGGVGSWEVAVFLNASKLQLLLDVRIFEWFTWNRILNIMWRNRDIIWEMRNSFCVKGWRIITPHWQDH